MNLLEHLQSIRMMVLKLPVPYRVIVVAFPLVLGFLIGWDWVVRRPAALPDMVPVAISRLPVCHPKAVECMSQASDLWYQQGWPRLPVVAEQDCGYGPNYGELQVRDCTDVVVGTAGCLDGNFDTVELELPDRSRGVAYLDVYDSTSLGTCVHIVGHALGHRDNRKGTSPMYYKGPWRFLDFADLPKAPPE